MKKNVISSIVGLSVAVLGLVIAITFNLTTNRYEAYAKRLEKENILYKKEIVHLKSVIEDIRQRAISAVPLKLAH